MLTLRDRVIALHQYSTPEARDAIRKYAFALHDPVVIEELENAQKPLTHTSIVGAIVRAALRHPTNKLPKADQTAPATNAPAHAVG
jgi:hypothetical protein